MSAPDAVFASSPAAPFGGRRWMVASGLMGMVGAAGLATGEPLVAGAAVLGAGLVVWATAPWEASRAARAAEAAKIDPEIDPAADGAALDALPDPVIVVEAGAAEDVGSRWVAHANPAAVRLMRIPRQGAALTSAVRDPDVLDAIEAALFGRITQTIGHETGGAQERYWEAWTAPLGPDGPRPRAVVRLRDETDSRRAELMRVDFLANASHELRTPLASLGGFIETLKGHARDDARARDKFLDIMAAQTERMSRLVADLLSLSRIELNEHVPPSGRVDLAGAAADVVDASAVLSAERGVMLKLDRRIGRATITGERDQMVQVIQNLVDNAVKYSPDGGQVDLIVAGGLDLAEAASWAETGAARLPLVTPDPREGARYAVVVVRDRGPGLEREHLPRLTERFYRVEGQKSGERPGTGLGLAIVKHIINRHGGGLIVESAPGSGSAFIVYLPMVEPRSEAAPTM